MIVYIYPPFLLPTHLSINLPTYLSNPSPSPPQRRGVCQEPKTKPNKNTFSDKVLFRFGCSDRQTGKAQDKFFVRSLARHAMHACKTDRETGRESRTTQRVASAVPRPPKKQKSKVRCTTSPLPSLLRRLHLAKHHKDS